MASIRFEGVSKQFAGQYAVRELDLTIADCEFLVLVGPSGCGKSTTLRLLAGLEEVSAGRIYIGDQLVNDVAARDRDIAMVFQSYALYPHMSVRENLSFGLSLRKVPRAEIDRRVQEAASALEIEVLLMRKPGQLSGGQRQRVALGRAMVRQPAVFLLDEPLSNLDAQLRLQTRAEIAKLHRRLGTTFVYVTHDQVEAMSMAERIAVMRDGRLQQVGTPEEVYRRPYNRFVASFIGSPGMNFLDARIAERSGELSVEILGLRFPLRGALSDTLEGRVGQPVTLGIRPEDIHDAALESVGNDAVSFDARVEVAEWLGNEVLLRLIVGNETLLARVDTRTNARADHEVKLSFDVSRIYLFDEAGLAIGPRNIVDQAFRRDQGATSS